MPDPITIIICERALERLVLAFFAGISLILGYRLFRAEIVGRQRGEMSWGNLKVKLLDVGPGIFFALFGAVVFGVLAYRTVDITDSNHLLTKGELRQSGNTKPEASHLRYGNAVEDVKLDSISDDDARAITTVFNLLATRQLAPALDGSQVPAFEKSKKGLQLLRKSAAYKRFPDIAENYEDWSAKTSLDPNFLATLKDEDRQQFLNMKAFLRDSYLTASKP